MNSFFKKIIVFFLLLAAFSGTHSAHAQGEGEAEYTQAATQIAAEYLKQIKEEATYTLEALRRRIQNLPRNDMRRPQAWEAIGEAEKEVFKLQDLYGIEITPSIGNAPPMAQPDTEFLLQQAKVQEGFVQLNRILLSPPEPDGVPKGDLVQDFIPQLVRQLFRFAWLAVFISFVVSGVMFVMTFGNDDRLDKAKKILYFSIIGFVVITLSFAMVKAITDIDFFGFI